MEDKQVVIFSLQSEEYGLEITAVQEIVRYQEVTKLPEAPDFITGIINLRGQIIPVVDLKYKFYKVNSEITDSTRIVVVKVGDKTLGIIADQVSEVLRITQDAIEAAPSLLPGFNQNGVVGVGKLEGRLILLLDVEKALNAQELNEIADVM